jgi:hypothetical protein
MNPVAVTAFFNIGRGSWESLSRSSNAYISFYRHYLARLPLPRYLLADADTQREVRDTVDFADSTSLDQLGCYRFMKQTEQVMASTQYRSLFNSDDDRNHVEHIYPEYNVLMMAKWDALERAAALTNNEFSHYVWIDFGLGHGAENSYLPPPVGFSPIEREKIVISAQVENGIARLENGVLIGHIKNFLEQVAGSIMIVPVGLIPTYCDLARQNYQRLLDMNLTADDQVVVDMCVTERPEIFYLSFPPRGLTKFNHIHNVLNGLDRVQPRTWSIPIYDRLTRKMARLRARRRIGLSV